MLRIRPLSFVVVVAALGACDSEVTVHGPFPAPEIGINCEPVIETLAPSAALPLDVVVDETHVYWSAEDGAIRAVPRGGGAVVVLAEGGESPARSLAADAELVYWTTAGQVHRVPKQGGPVVMLADDQHGATGITIDQEQVHWACSGSGAIRSVSKTGGWVQELAMVEPAPTWLAVDEGHVYWLAMTSATRTVGRVAKLGGDPQVLHSYGSTALHRMARSLAVDEQGVYWADSVAGSVWRIPKSGGQATALVPAGMVPWGLTISDGSVFFSDQSSTRWAVRRVPTTGGAVTTVADVDPDEGLWFYPHAIAVDGGEVFWTDQNVDSVMRAACTGP